MINVEDYRSSIRNFIKAKRFSCIYLIASDKGIPTKIGIAGDIYARLKQVQVGNWIKLDVQYILWLPGKEASERVESELHYRYEQYNIGGEWFDLHYSIIENEVDIIARVLYPSVFLSTHSDMIGYAIKKIDGKFDRMLARVGL